MKDFLGNEISPGQFVAKGAAGNRNAEYGMILHLVETVDNEGINTIRLSVDYPRPSGPPDISSRRVRLVNPNTVVVVDPPARVKSLFTAARLGKISAEEQDLIGRWIHGPTHVRPWDKIDMTIQESDESDD